MAHPIQFNDFVRPIIAITDLLVKLRSLYKSTAPIIKEEHDAMSRGDIKSVDRLCQRKNILADEISKLTDETGYYLQRLGEAIESYSPLPRGISLSTCLAAIDLFLEKESKDIRTSSYQDKVFHAAFDRFKAEIQAFKNDMKDVQPLIETHYLVVQKGIRHIQNSYNFWQSLASEADATYTPRGKQKNQELSSLLRVKA